MMAPRAVAINQLAGYRLRVPRVDGLGMPVGGIPMVEAQLPLGRPRPPAISPVGTRSIVDVCGNFGGWEPLSTSELKEMYGSLDGFLARTAGLLAEQVSAGYLLPEDRDSEYLRLVTVARKAFAGTEKSQATTAFR